MQNYEVRDISLATSGHQKIEWVRKNMPLLRGLEEEFSKTKPFEGVKISLSVHLEAKTAYLCLVLAAGGADMSVTGSNVLSTQDDVAADFERLMELSSLLEQLQNELSEAFEVWEGLCEE